MKLLKIIVLVAAFNALLKEATASELQSREPRKCLRGSVVSAVSAGNHRPNAMVTLHSETFIEQAFTVVGGVFRFCNIPNGEYILEATSPVYKSWRRPLSCGTNSDLNFNITIVLETVSPPSLPFRGSRNVDGKALQISRGACKKHERSLQYAAKGNWEEPLKSLEKTVAAWPLSHHGKQSGCFGPHTLVKHIGPQGLHGFLMARVPFRFSKIGVFTGGLNKRCTLSDFDRPSPP
jgi:hypothetical protein